ncbi:MAG: copper chaperone PCu(A)C [Gammaproteobacteria bacterium]
MTRRVLQIAALLVLATGAVTALAAPPALQEKQAWIRWLPMNLPAAGYVTIENHGARPARLVSATSPDYGSVVLHRSEEANGIDRMLAVSTIEIPAHGAVALAPGGYHLMLSGARRAIEPGDQVRITLHFAGGASLQVDFPVRPASASGP